MSESKSKMKSKMKLTKEYKKQRSELFKLAKKSKTTSSQIKDMLEKYELPIDIKNNININLLKYCCKYTKNYEVIKWLIDNKFTKTDDELSDAFTVLLYDTMSDKKIKENVYNLFMNNNVKYKINNNKSNIELFNIISDMSYCYEYEKRIYDKKKYYLAKYIDSKYDITERDSEGNIYLHHYMKMYDLPIHYYINPLSKYYVFTTKIDINSVNNKGDTILHTYVKKYTTNYYGFYKSRENIIISIKNFYKEFPEDVLQLIMTRNNDGNTPIELLAEWICKSLYKKFTISFKNIDEIKEYLYKHLTTKD